MVHRAATKPLVVLKWQNLWEGAALAGPLVPGLQPSGPCRWRTKLIPLQAIKPQFGQEGRIFGVFDKLCHGQHVEMFSNRQ